MSSAPASLRSASGPRAALEREIQTAYPALLALLRRLTGRAEIAQELCQDAVVRLIENEDRVTDVRAWLFRTATHLAWDWLRRQRVRSEHAAAHPPIEVRSTDASGEASAMQQLAALKAALQSMPEQPRRVFELSRFSHLSQQEIAARLGIRRKTVENHLTRALALLARALDTDHETKNFN